MDPSGTAQGARVQAEAEVSDLRADPALVAASYDAHCHAHLDDTHEGVAAMESLFERVSGVALMSTGEGDWDRIQAAAAKARAGGSAGSVRCLLGVHPWFAHRYAGEGDGWLEDLRARLVGTPGACIGEIGLDKQWVTPDTGRVEYDAQLEVFKAQLELAAELRLPVSVHCVRAQGDLQAILSAAKALPPTIYLHAFGGAVGTVQQLCKSKKFGDRCARALPRAHTEAARCARVVRCSSDGACAMRCQAVLWFRALRQHALEEDAGCDRRCATRQAAARERPRLGRGKDRVWRRRGRCGARCHAQGIRRGEARTAAPVAAAARATQRTARNALTSFCCLCVRTVRARRPPLRAGHGNAA